MVNEPSFVTTGKKTGNIDVLLSYRIIELFSEGLYASPNKALEELVANSFDAGAARVHVLLSQDLYHKDASIVVIDDGQGMDANGLKLHWRIGTSNKRKLTVLPSGRKQIGKFGIGKLATFVLANRLTHICKYKSKYYSTSMDFARLRLRTSKTVEPKATIKIPLRSLSEQEAKLALDSLFRASAIKGAGMPMFGSSAPESWTVAVMSSLKEKVHELRPGMLEWVLRTALPLRPDFSIWLNGKKLESSKEGKNLLRKWILGKDLIELPKPSPDGVQPSEDKRVDKASAQRFGLIVPNLGRITGYAEAYKDLLTGKSDEIGRSYGFFVYAFGRLLNVADGHFGISPDELRHGTFGRFRLVVHMDGLDDGLRSNREAIGEGPLLSTAQDILRAIFNAVRPSIEKHEKEESPGEKLARNFAASPKSLTSEPIVQLARAVIEGRAKSKYLIIPEYGPGNLRDEYLASLERRAEGAEQFVSKAGVDYNSSSVQGIARYDTVTGDLRINPYHPFVSTFYDEFTKNPAREPLEIFAMAEILNEAHLFAIGLKAAEMDEFILRRDQLLRYMANQSERKSAFAVARELQDARNSPHLLEEKLCAAFSSLGFEVTPIGGRGRPDGVAEANLSAENDVPRRYKVSLEAKSKEMSDDAGKQSSANARRTARRNSSKTSTTQKVSAKSVGISTVARHRKNFGCDHAIVVGQAFPTLQGDKSALLQMIDADRKPDSEGRKKTITLITIDDLARLVRLRPVKQVGLRKMRELFENCRSPEESAKWVKSIQELVVQKPPYSKIISTIQQLQKDFVSAAVEYGDLRVKLSVLIPPIKYQNNQELIELCKGMMQMAPGAIFAGPKTVELDQSPENVIKAIEDAMRESEAGEF